MEPKGALVLWKFKFCAKNHLVKVGTLNWCIKHTVYIHKGTVQRHLCLIEGVYLPLRGKLGVFSIKKFASVSLYMAKRDIKALCLYSSFQVSHDRILSISSSLGKNSHDLKWWFWSPAWMKTDWSSSSFLTSGTGLYWFLFKSWIRN